MQQAAADKACEVLGCGAFEPDTAPLSFGTAASINTTQPRYMEVQRLLPAYPTALPGAFNTEVHIPRGFWLVSSFKRKVGQIEARLKRPIVRPVVSGGGAQSNGAAQAMARSGRVFEPQPDAVRTCDTLYREVYRPLYSRLQPPYRRIRSITGYPA